MVSKDEASQIVVCKVRTDWISKNVYLLSEWSVAKRIRDKFDYLLNMRKSEKGPGNRSDQWCIQVSNFNKKMTTRAFDIKATDH